MAQTVRIQGSKKLQYRFGRIFETQEVFCGRIFEPQELLCANILAHEDPYQDGTRQGIRNGQIIFIFFSASTYRKKY